MGSPDRSGRLGRYEIIKHLASGGMAELLLARARGLEGFERHFAIKRILFERERDAAFVDMFLAEARIAATLHHQNIVQVHDIGEEDGVPYFAMEYVHGEDLRRVLATLHKTGKKMPLEHVIAVIESVAAGLHHAHEAVGPDRKPLDVVHRDVAPANILIGYDGGVKIVDFGIARAALRSTETLTGMLAGKAPYMAPEQCSGGDIDRRSDVFALGIVMFELLTTRRLFKGDSDFMTMTAVVDAIVPAPSTLRPGIPPALDAIVKKALMRHPADRYQTAEEMHLDLHRTAVALGMRSSTGGLAGFMKELFGQRVEPWHGDDNRPPIVGTDFDGNQPGIAEPAQNALDRTPPPPSKPTPMTIARTAAMHPMSTASIAVAKLEAALTSVDSSSNTVRIPEAVTVVAKQRAKTMQVPLLTRLPARNRPKTVQIPAQRPDPAAPSDDLEIPIDQDVSVATAVTVVEDSAAVPARPVKPRTGTMVMESLPLRKPAPTPATPAAAKHAPSSAPVASRATPPPPPSRPTPPPPPSRPTPPAAPVMTRGEPRDTEPTFQSGEDAASAPGAALAGTPKKPTVKISPLAFSSSAITPPSTTPTGGMQPLKATGAIPSLAKSGAASAKASDAVKPLDKPKSDAKPAEAKPDLEHQPTTLEKPIDPRIAKDASVSLDVPSLVNENLTVRESAGDDDDPIIDPPTPVPGAPNAAQWTKSESKGAPSVRPPVIKTATPPAGTSRALAKATSPTQAGTDAGDAALNALTGETTLASDLPSDSMWNNPNPFEPDEPSVIVRSRSLLLAAVAEEEETRAREEGGASKLSESTSIDEAASTSNGATSTPPTGVTPAPAGLTPPPSGGTPTPTGFTPPPRFDGYAAKAGTLGTHGSSGSFTPPSMHTLETMPLHAPMARDPNATPLPPPMFPDPTLPPMYPTGPYPAEPEPTPQPGLGPQHRLSQDRITPLPPPPMGPPHPHPPWAVAAPTEDQPSLPPRTKKILWGAVGIVLLSVIIAAATSGGDAPTKTATSDERATPADKSADKPTDKPTDTPRHEIGTSMPARDPVPVPQPPVDKTIDKPVHTAPPTTTATATPKTTPKTTAKTTPKTPPKKTATAVPKTKSIAKTTTSTKTAKTTAKKTTPAKKTPTKTTAKTPAKKTTPAQKKGWDANTLFPKKK